MTLADTAIAQNVFFGLIAAVILLGAVRVVTTKNVVHAALWLVLVLAGAGANFLLVGAEFVGVTQILVYVGAIVVLFLFGTMLTRAPIGHDLQLTNRNWWVGVVVALPLLGVLSYVLLDQWSGKKLPQGPEVTSQPTAEVSDSIFATYLIPFEAIGLLLTAALIGAIVLARKE